MCGALRRATSALRQDQIRRQENAVLDVWNQVVQRHDRLAAPYCFHTRIRTSTFTALHQTCLLSCAAGELLQVCRRRRCCAAAVADLQRAAVRDVR